jgi:antitoxin HicB
MKTTEEYLCLPYHIVLVRDTDEDGNTGYVASVEELPGCISQGDTPDDAVSSVQDAMCGWIEAAREQGESIPEPRAEPTFSGKFMVRGPRSLHRELVRIAGEEGVSLNQYVVSTLASAVGRQSASRRNSQSTSVAD